MSIWLTILGLLGGLLKIVLNVLELSKQKKNIQDAKQLEKAEQAIKESELLRKQTEILLDDTANKANTIKKLESGNF